MKDKTNWEALKNMTEAEIEKNAMSDPDAPLLTEKELKQFKRAHPVQETEIDIRKIRNHLHLSQEKFAFYFGVSKRTIQEWEQGRRTPTGPARNFLKVVELEPQAVRRALEK